MEPLKPSELLQLFNKFAGRTVLDPERLTCDEDDTIMEMRDIAEDNGLTLRVVFPGMVPIMSPCTGRVNAMVEKDTDGKLRVKRFSLG